MTDDMLGPFPMHIKYVSYVYDGFCICRTNIPNFLVPLSLSYPGSPVIYKFMSAPILREGLWPTVGHLVNTHAKQGGCTGNTYIFPNTLLFEPLDIVYVVCLHFICNLNEQNTLLPRLK